MPPGTVPVVVRTLRSAAGDALALDDLDAKAAAVRALVAKRLDGSLVVGADDAVALVPVDQPGRPARPELVPPRQLRARKLTTPEGRAAAIHAVAHIEANAVNLALDAVHRFAGMPDAYYDDWLRVADEEALHFSLLRGRLAAHGADYGDLPAHDGLWQQAVRTADDPLRRMALVPRVLEARGLDVTPGMIERFAAAGDDETAAVLRRILADEVGHVAIGDRWFRWLCDERGVEPEATFAAVLADARVRVVPPLNVDARRRAGFGDDELASIAAG